MRVAGEGGSDGGPARGHCEGSAGCWSRPTERSEGGSPLATVVAANPRDCSCEVGNCGCCGPIGEGGDGWVGMPLGSDEFGAEPIELSVELGAPFVSHGPLSSVSGWTVTCLLELLPTCVYGGLVTGGVISGDDAFSSEK